MSNLTVITTPKQTLKAVVYGEEKNKITEIDLQVFDLNIGERYETRHRFSIVFVMLWDCLVEVVFSDEHGGVEC